MTDNQRFARLLAEFRRVGVDPDTFSAVIAVTPDDALRVLASLPDDAGPAAFLARLREEREERSHTPPGSPVQAARDLDEPAHDARHDHRRRA